MRTTWALCSMELLRLLKKPQSYLLMFAMPLLFTLIFGSLLGEEGEEKIKILVVDQDKSVLSQSLYKQIIEENTFFDVQKSSIKQAKQMLEEKEVSGALILSKGFQAGVLAGEAPEVKFQRIPEFTSSSTIIQFISNKIAKTTIEVSGSEKWSGYTGESWEAMYDKVSAETNTAALNINKRNIDEKSSVPQLNGMSARASGFSIMFVMIVMMSVTGTILEARKNGVWYRMLTTPSSRMQLSAGYLLSFFLIGWIQFGVLMTATHFMFGVNWGNLLANILLVSAMLCAVVGLGLFIAALVKTVEQQASIGNLVVVSTCMISGVYWPLEIEPMFMQKMADFLPQTWAMRGFTDLVANGGSLTDVLDNVGILLAFAALFMVLGMRKIKFE
ncbi:ABC transporter permease [Bacillus sp. M6-12]|uniref:ABC transporter permease n=1 Tax=Bacillus sp. M6-12 TaxID=2054166 RepID=UPI000C75E3ED|nr:ABC transporter permease [Bacillus sp. M6-12]PLS16119.1 ABC transporter permease [Bacillus sp. M6-12]